jgi:hypothetical protein
MKNLVIEYMKVKFVHYLFLPTAIVVAWWLFGVPLFIFPNFNFLQSNIYSILVIGVLSCIGIFIVADMIHLIYRKQYKNFAAIIIGIPLAFLIGFLSVILLFAFGRILGR